MSDMQDYIDKIENLTGEVQDNIGALEREHHHWQATLRQIREFAEKISEFPEDATIAENNAHHILGEVERLGE